jgi:hypothetical protein
MTCGGVTMTHMNFTRRSLFVVLTALSMGAFPIAGLAQGGAGAQAAAARQMGSVTAITGNTLTLKTDSGSEAKVVVQDSTRILRVAPGQKDLKDAATIQLSDLVVGDRVLSRGTQGEDGQSLVATTVIVMKQSDVAEKQQHERDEWQRHGVGGIITAIDVAGSALTVTSAPGSTIALKTSKDTNFLRYAPDSIKFSDAKPGTFDQIKNGDQLRARGTRSADGKEFAADQIISGSFRNIAGTILSIDAAKNTISVMDLFKKKSVTVTFTSDSQLRKLPPPVAQRIAFALKARGAEGSGQSAGPGPAAGATAQTAQKTNAAITTQPGQGRPEAGQGPRPEGGGGPRSGAPDMQQFLGRLPAVTLADMQKGDAVMLVSAEGAADSDVKAITLLTGVEPILTASPTNSATAAILSAWNMGGGGEGGPQ